MFHVERIGPVRQCRVLPGIAQALAVAPQLLVQSEVQSRRQPRLLCSSKKFQIWATAF